MLDAAEQGVGVCIGQNRNQHQQTAPEQQRGIPGRPEDEIEHDADDQREPDSHGEGHGHAGYGNGSEEQHVGQIEDHATGEAEEQLPLAGVHEVVYEGEAIET